ncbi:MAG TPA: N-acetylmuramoyl-L-alanine amidase [Caulobacterales bacterium]|nr:N-acetylmuramoyl-L-alanine amidase [Caulobacterales bacterium]
MTLDRRHFLQFAGLAALGAAAPARAWAAAPTIVRGVSLQDMAGAVRVAVAVDRTVLARTSFLTGPDRFVIDMADAVWAPGAPAQGAGVGAVVRYRCGQHPGAARLVLDLNAPGSLISQAVGGHRNPGLSFDLASAAAPVAAAPVLVRRDNPGLRRTVVLDPGHGGHDPGAIGVAGTREKDVVLDAALKLKAALEARGQYRVELTRSDDRFVPLPDRVAFARAQNAELFISMHADSAPNRDATGASVYTLSEHGADRAQNLMDSQNWDVDLGSAPRRGMVGDILVDLAQRETTNKSAEFAETLIRGLGGVSPLAANTHRSAGFFVLLAPDVPAVLIETGFLSNAADERRLGDPRTRERMAEAMAGAVDLYFNRAAPIYVAGA